MIFESDNLGATAPDKNIVALRQNDIIWGN